MNIVTGKPHIRQIRPGAWKCCRQLSSYLDPYTCIAASPERSYEGWRLLRERQEGTHWRLQEIREWVYRKREG